MLYECHITVSSRDSEMAARVAQELHWKTSEIARDPVLGMDTYFYLTTHSDDLIKIMERLKSAVKYLAACDINVIREKIELIVYDTKVKV